MGFFSKLVAALAFATLVPFPTSTAVNIDTSNTFLAGPLDKDCAEGVKYEGNARGKNVTFAGVPTYLTTPSRMSNKDKRVILFLSDIYGPFYVNNILLQDHFASKGYHVVGIDYFLGDPLGDRINDPTFNSTAWIAKTQTQVKEILPKWMDAIRNEYGSSTRYTAVGYCFGGPYATEAAATDWISAAAFAHPSFLTEEHISNVKKPLLLSCAETDTVFPTASRRRAIDLLVEKNATYHHQVFSGTTHGFAVRSDPADPNAAWARNESARSVIAWFDRFTL